MSNKKSVGILTILNLIGVFLSILYSIIQAIYFGVSREIEIYFAAIAIMKTFQAITQGGQLAEILLPTFHEAKREGGTERARAIFSVVVNWMVIFVIASSIITWALTPLFADLFVPGFSPSDKSLIVDMTRFLVLFIVLDLMISLFNTLFNAEKNYGIPETANLFNSLISIVLLVALYESLGIWVVVISQTIGKIVNFITFLFILKKSKYRHCWTFNLEGFNQWAFFKNMFNTSVYVMTSQLHQLIMSAGLSMLPQGYYALYNFVNKFYSKFSGVLLRPVSIVYFTRFSELVKGNQNTLKKELSAALRYNFVIAFYCLYFLIILGSSFLSFLWESEKFSIEFINYAYILFIAFLVSFNIEGTSLIYRKLVMSYGYFKEQFLWTSLLQVIKAGIVWLMLPALGFAGVLIVVITNKLFFGIVPFVITRWKLPQFNMGINLIYFIKRIIVLIVGYVIVVSNTYLLDYTIGQSKLADFKTSIISFAFGVLLLIPFIKIFKFEEFENLLKFLKTKFLLLKKA